MKLYKVKLRTGQELYGHVSKVDAADGRFWLLQKDQIGLQGKDGIELKFEDCLGVHHETQYGDFSSDEQMKEWIRHARKLALL